ncbi:MAG: CvpA family protein [Oscillospiraceae bacterium]|nr:CvpA family protein [Oscillospiraceae bacterium]
MNAILDIIIIGIIIFCVAMGYKNGFVKTVMNFLSFIIAFFMAKTFSPPLSEFMYSSWIKPNFADKAAAQLEKFLTPSVNLDSLVQNQQNDFVNMLKGYGFELPDIKSWINDAASKGVSDVNGYITTNLVEPVAKGISDFLAFVAILAVALILLKIATMLINKAVKLPGLNLINRTGGILLGLLYGIVLSYIFVLLAYYVLPYLAANTAISSVPSVVDDTIFFKWFYGHSPINYIMNLN